MKNDQLQPLWTTLPTLSKDHLSISSRKKQCKPSCGCVSKKFVVPPFVNVVDHATDFPNFDYFKLSMKLNLGHLKDFNAFQPEL